MTFFTEPIHPLETRRLLVALVATFLLPVTGGLFWAGSAANRIAQLEHTVASDQAAVEQVAVMEEQIAAMKQSLDRIEAKLDRVGERPQH